MSTNRDWSWKPDRETQAWLSQAETKRAGKNQVKRVAKKAAKHAKKRRNKIIRETVAKYATKIPDDFYQSWEWKKLRYEVLKAYGAVCMCCHAVERIVVDHIKSKRRHPELALSFDNMQVLCDDCNRGKSYDDETDWRPKSPAPELQGDEAEHMRSILQ